MKKQQSIEQMQQLTNQEEQRQLQLQADNEIDLKELFFVIWQGKWTIIITTIIAAVIAVIYAISLPDIYKSEVLLAPAEESKSGGMAGLAAQFGGLTSIAGINLGGSGSDKAKIALEIIKGKVFVAKFINSHNLKATIMATNGWNQTSNKLIYNTDIYNPETNTWMREVKAPKQAEPSDLEVHERFIKSLSISSNKETGLVTLSIKHYSPYVAKDIVEKLVLAINEKLKNDDIRESNKSIEYLQDALNKSPIADMQKVFYQLIEQQEQTKMLASVRDQYALKIINPAVVEEKKDSPKRALVVILAVMFGGMLSAAIVLIRSFMGESSINVSNKKS
ncbi:MAG: hypothetical protein ACI9VT_003195 [Psychroserpens sp.]|jgi:uncharacterized protein involved in exopolysaccharide biosynthesis